MKKLIIILAILSVTLTANISVSNLRFEQLHPVEMNGYMCFDLHGSQVLQAKLKHYYVLTNAVEMLLEMNDLHTMSIQALETDLQYEQKKRRIYTVIGVVAGLVGGSFVTYKLIK